MMSDARQMVIILLWWIEKLCLHHDQLHRAPTNYISQPPILAITRLQMSWQWCWCSQAADLRPDVCWRFWWLVMVVLIITDCHGNTGGRLSRADPATLRPHNTTTSQQQQRDTAQVSDVKLWPHPRNGILLVLLSCMIWWWCVPGDVQRWCIV